MSTIKREEKTYKDYILISFFPWKIDLIEKDSPNWIDLSKDWTYFNK